MLFRSHLLAVGLMRSSAVVDIVLSRSAPSPHTLSYLPAVVLMRSSAVVGILLSWSAPSPTLSHLLAVVLMRPSAVVSIVLSWSAPSLTHSLIYWQWCSCAHLLSWASSSRGLLPHRPSHLPAVGLSRVGGESSVSLALLRARE